MMMYHLLVHTLMVTASVQGQDADGDSSVMAWPAYVDIETIDTWYYCGQDETYNGCDNEECSIQWFHLSCVG